MTAPDPSEPESDDELQLKTLFDQTATEVDGPLITRMSAHAGDVPAQVQRRPTWVPRWAWAPGMAAAAVAAGVLIVAFAPSYLGSGTTQSQTSSLTGAAVLPMPRNESPTLEQPSTVSDAVVTAVIDDTDDEWGFAAFDMSWDEDDLIAPDDALDPWFGPTADANLDAWLYAAQQLLGEGG